VVFLPELVARLALKQKFSTLPNFFLFSSLGKLTTDNHRKSRGRPPKMHNEINIDNSFNRSSESASDKPKQKKNREVENLINMDFGPGKTPFAVCFWIILSRF
jgi:hypothetical protein